MIKVESLKNIVRPPKTKIKIDVIKSVVDDKIEEGMTEKEIYNFLSEKYGDWILFNPPFKKSSYVLWFLPYVLFVMGALFLFYLFKRSSIRKKQ